MNFSIGSQSVVLQTCEGSRDIFRKSVVQNYFPFNDKMLFTFLNMLTFNVLSGKEMVG